MISKSTIDDVYQTARVEEVIGDFLSLKKSGVFGIFLSLDFIFNKDLKLTSLQFVVTNRIMIESLFIYLIIILNCAHRDWKIPWLIKFQRTRLKKMNEIKKY